MKTFKNLPKNGKIVFHSDLKLKVKDDNIFPSFGENEFIEIWIRKYIDVFDKDGNKYKIQNGFETEYYQLSDDEILKDWFPNGGDNRILKICFKNKIYNYRFFKDDSFYSHVSSAIDILNENKYRCIFIGDNGRFGHIYENMYRYHKSVDFSKMPFLEHISMSIYRVVPHREALVMKDIKCDVLRKSVSKYKTMNQKVNLMIKSMYSLITVVTDMPDWTLSQVINQKTKSVQNYDFLRGHDSKYYRFIK